MSVSIRTSAKVAVGHSETCIICNSRNTFVILADFTFGTYKSGLIKKGPDGKPIKERNFTQGLGKAINPLDPNMFLNEKEMSSLSFNLNTCYFKSVDRIIVLEGLVKCNHRH